MVVPNGTKIDEEINFPYVMCANCGKWFKVFMKGKNKQYSSVTLRENIILGNINKYQNYVYEENKKLKECVEFYASEDNWDDCWIDGCPGSEDYFTSIKNDMGSRVGGFCARETLKEIK